MLNQLIGILLSVYLMVNEITTFLYSKTKVTLAVVAFFLARIPMFLQFYFFILASRKFGFGFKKYVIHSMLSWVSVEYYEEMMPHFHVKLPLIFSSGDPFGHWLKQDYIGCLLTMNPDDTKSNEKFEVYDPAKANKSNWMSAAKSTFLQDSPNTMALEIMFCKYTRNCKLACQYLTYSGTIIIYVGTTDDLELRNVKRASNMGTFCVLSSF